MLIDILYAIGFCLVPTLLIWSALYTVIKFTGKELSGKLAAVSLVLIHVITSVLVGLLQGRDTLGFGFVFGVGLGVGLVVFSWFRGKLKNIDNNKQSQTE